MMRGLVEMALAPLSSWRRLVVFLSILSATSSYTVDDLKTRCVPCRHADRVSHPTICTFSLYCTGLRKWEFQQCPADTYYDSATLRCVSKLQKPPCPYDRGINPNKDLPLSQVPQCKGIVHQTTASVNPTTAIAATTSLPPNPANTSLAPHPTTTPSPPGPDGSRTTTILAVLLGLTFLILIVIVVGIFIYRKRQRRWHPKYNRSFPNLNSQRNGMMSTAAPTANAAYLSRSLLREESIVESDIYEVPSSGDPNYAEIPERTSKAYYSEAALNPRPVIPTPQRGATAALLTEKSENLDNHIYAETTVVENEMYTQPDINKHSYDTYTHPDINKPFDDTYTHPDINKPSDEMYSQPDISNPSDDICSNQDTSKRHTYNHLYAETDDIHVYTKPGPLDGEETYDYCDPLSAHPTLRHDAEPLQDTPSHPLPESPPESPPEFPPESPPYYVDPIPDMLFPNNAPPQYHTLAP